MPFVGAISRSYLFRPSSVDVCFRCLSGKKNATFTTFTFHWLCLGKKLLGVPETWLCQFAGRPSHASPTLLEDGPPPWWIHLLPGFWILCEDLDHSRNRQAQPTNSRMKGWFRWNCNALLLFSNCRLDVGFKTEICWNMLCCSFSWSTSIQLLQFQVPAVFQDILGNLIGYSDLFKGGTKSSLHGQGR